jgi:hypothetical protein
MAIDAEAQGPETRMNRPNCRELRFVATPFAEIAPRRSPVRVRLAPCQEGLQIRAFGFHIRQGTDGEGAGGQVLVKRPFGDVGAAAVG